MSKALGLLVEAVRRGGEEGSELGSPLSGEALWLAVFLGDSLLELIFFP